MVISYVGVEQHRIRVIIIETNKVRVKAIKLSNDEQKEVVKVNTIKITLIKVDIFIEIKIFSD